MMFEPARHWNRRFDHSGWISEIGKEYVVNPLADLRPMCPNCHAVLHRRTSAYSIEEVRSFLQRAQRA
jgi:predicted HNH restriction endonuclease